MTADDRTTAAPFGPDTLARTESVQPKVAALPFVTRTPLESGLPSGRACEAPAGPWSGRRAASPLRGEHRPRVQPRLNHVLPQLGRHPVQRPDHLSRIPVHRGDGLPRVADPRQLDPPAGELGLIWERAGAPHLVNREEPRIHPRHDRPSVAVRVVYLAVAALTTTPADPARSIATRRLHTMGDRHT